LVDANLKVGTDPLYLADGAWSTWTEAANGRISVFEPQPQAGEAPEGVWAVERDLAAQGTVRTWVTILRHLRPAARPVDLRGFDYLEFTASGTGVLEIVPQKRSISDFSRQFRTKAVLAAEPQTVRVRFNDLGDGFSPDDVTTLVFNVLGNHTAEEAFDLRLSGVRFGSDTR
jgi:hypothetical protein